MPNIQMPVERLNSLIRARAHIGSAINSLALNDLGFCVVSNALPAEVCQEYKVKYDDYKTSKDFDRTPFHLTEVKVSLDHSMAGILTEPPFIEFAKQFFGGNVGLFNIRIVKKDATDTKPVFLHQDIGYQHGSFNRYSLFIPLTECNDSNGGLTFFPGTHKFGYLGDAGSINDIAPSDLIRPTPSVYPGDIIIMDSALWHMSGPNNTQAERVYYDIHINHADDTATKYTICGSRENDWSINYDQDFIFESSRTQRLRSLYKQLENLRADDKSK